MSRPPRGVAGSRRFSSHVRRVERVAGLSSPRTPLGCARIVRLPSTSTRIRATDAWMASRTFPFTPLWNFSVMPWRWPFRHGGGELHHRWLLAAVQLGQLGLESCPATLCSFERCFHRREIAPPHRPLVIGDLAVQLGEDIQLGIHSGSSRSRVSPLRELTV